MHSRAAYGQGAPLRSTLAPSTLCDPRSAISTVAFSPHSVRSTERASSADLECSIHFDARSLNLKYQNKMLSFSSFFYTSCVNFLCSLTCTPLGIYDSARRLRIGRRSARRRSPYGAGLQPQSHSMVIGWRSECAEWPEWPCVQTWQCVCFSCL